MNKFIDAYVKKITEELEYLNTSGFTGNIEFQVNCKGGKIANMNIGVKQSWKLETDYAKEPIS